eukprot:CAMPEP_0170560550 /NCGR_PEP_ID=MMETSP0211-20121228/49486_1 /TAXON_ID=311385 /ORGANISM="Pseudokeronopsis sp., Strain OXSARD2" /LENGTH=57 /DNA_ID=CAMNT_0010874851 /DNA_START=10 /DNA_END=179 /DNA_ORIENTATION=-
MIAGRVIKDVYPNENNLQLGSMKELLMKIDRDIFQQMKDGKLTYGQLQMRIMGKLEG